MSYINVVRINNAARYSNYPFLGEVTKYLDDFVFARVDNWDGHCAEALKISVLEAADQLLRSLGSPVPSEVAPGKDGSLSFVWCLEEKIVYCDVGPADALHAYAGNSETFWETVSRLDDTLLVGRLAHELLDVATSSAWIAPRSRERGSSYIPMPT